MRRQAAFAAAGQWRRGNVHTHTTLSDGEAPPEEAIAFYRQNGYNFVALTEHLVYGAGRQDGFLVLPGVEMHGTDPQRGMYHVVGLGAGAGLADLQLMESGNDFEADVRRLRGLGMWVHCAHPYWSGQSSSIIAPIEGLGGIEVYNGVADVGIHKGYSNQTWDELLHAGRRLWGLAVDDAHWLSFRIDHGLGWLMVKAAELTTPAIVEALHAGAFYASTGPTIEDFWIDGDEVAVRCGPAAIIAFIGDGWMCTLARAGTGRGITEARARLWEGQTYVRVEVLDRAGKTAWSNPLFLADGR